MWDCGCETLLNALPNLPNYLSKEYIIRFKFPPIKKNYSQEGEFFKIYRHVSSCVWFQNARNTEEGGGISKSTR